MILFMFMELYGDYSEDHLPSSYCVPFFRHLIMTNGIKNCPFICGGSWGWLKLEKTSEASDLRVKVVWSFEWEAETWPFLQNQLEVGWSSIFREKNYRFYAFWHQLKDDIFFLLKIILNQYRIFQRRIKMDRLKDLMSLSPNNS